MIITDEMIEQFLCSADVESKPWGAVEARVEIKAGLVAVAPMIAEQAVAGYIEQGAQLARARELLKRTSDQADLTWVPSLADDIDEFLGRP